MKYPICMYLTRTWVKKWTQWNANDEDWRKLFDVTFLVYSSCCSMLKGKSFWRTTRRFFHNNHKYIPHYVVYRHRVLTRMKFLLSFWIIWVKSLWYGEAHITLCTSSTKSSPRWSQREILHMKKFACMQVSWCTQKNLILCFELWI